MRLIVLILFAITLHAQTISSTISSNATFQSSAGGACTLSTKVSGTASFAWACGASPTGETTQTGTYTTVAGQTNVILWMVNDLFCMVLPNGGTTSWGVFPNTTTQVATLTIPAGAVGVSCVSRSGAVNQTPVNTIIN
jgi:hypothetical protein